MDHKILHFLLIIITIHTNLHQLALSSPDDVESPAEVTAPLSKTADNETLYKISEELCKDCPSGQAVEYVFAHNLFRAKKGLPPLAWDSNVANYAAKWADERRHGCEVEHSTPPADNDVGENIYWGSGKDWKPMDAVAAWADEEKFYDYESNSCKEGEMCGHYTQLMWNTTEKVGCAQVVCDTGDTFITCNYSPPGNYVDEQPY